jgi:hypothetical protein
MVALTGIEPACGQLPTSLHVLTGVFCAFLVFSNSQNTATNPWRRHSVVTRSRFRIARRAGGSGRRRPGAVPGAQGAVAAPVPRAWTLGCARGAGRARGQAQRKGIPFSPTRPVSREKSVRGPADSGTGSFPIHFVEQLLKLLPPSAQVRDRANVVHMPNASPTDSTYLAEKRSVSYYFMY